LELLCLLSFERHSLDREHSRWKAESIELSLIDGDVDRFSGSNRPRSCGDLDSLLHIGPIVDSNDLRVRLLGGGIHPQRDIEVLLPPSRIDERSNEDGQ
jgi:hypothetical protein